MNDMITALRRWWQGREPRERAMLATMAAMLAAFAWWYGLLWPLRALREETEARHARAVATLHAAEAAEAAAAALGTSAAATAQPPGGEALQRLLLDSTREVGLAPSRQRTAPDGSFVLEFERVASPALFGWLGGLVDTHGIAPASLRVERTDGQLRVEAGFAGAAP